MVDRAGILVDYTAAIDYCQPSIPEYSQTRKVVEDAHSNGFQIDIRQECWSRLSSSIGNLVKVFMALRDEASELLKIHGDEEQAMEEFNDQVLHRKTLDSIGVDVDSPYLPNIQDLEEAVKEMGLGKFRQYADDQINRCPRGQERLELLIDNRYSKGGESVTYFEAGVRTHITDEKRVRLLLGAYTWSKTNPGFLLTRCNSDIHNMKTKIEDCISDSRFSIVCPDEYSP